MSINEFINDYIKKSNNVEVQKALYDLLGDINSCVWLTNVAGQVVHVVLDKLVTGFSCKKCKYAILIGYDWYCILHTKHDPDGISPNGFCSAFKEDKEDKEDK